MRVHKVAVASCLEEATAILWGSEVEGSKDSECPRQSTKMNVYEKKIPFTLW